MVRSSLLRTLSEQTLAYLLPVLTRAIRLAREELEDTSIDMHDKGQLQVKLGDDLTEKRDKCGVGSYRRTISRTGHADRASSRNHSTRRRQKSGTATHRWCQHPSTGMPQLSPLSFRLTWNPHFSDSSPQDKATGCCRDAWSPGRTLSQRSPPLTQVSHPCHGRSR